MSRGHQGRNVPRNWELWSFRTGGRADEATAADGTIYTWSEDGNLYAIRVWESRSILAVPAKVPRPRPGGLAGAGVIGCHPGRASRDSGRI